MQKLILLSLAAILCAGTQLSAKTFMDRYVKIYEQATGSKPETVLRYSTQAQLDSLSPEDKNDPEMVQKVRNIRQFSMSATKSMPDADNNKKLRKLVSEYEELAMVRSGIDGGTVIVKMRKDRIKEVVVLINYNWNFPWLPAKINMLGQSVEFIVNIAFKKPVTPNELAEYLGDEDRSDDSESGAKHTPLLAFSVADESTQTMGRWFGGNIPAKEWKIKTVNGKQGLYDTDGKQILAPEYDKIEHYTGFIKQERTAYVMYILGFQLTRDGKMGYADLSGKVVVPVEYDKILHFEIEASRYMCIYKDGLQGLRSEITGELAVPVQYKIIEWRGKYIELVTATGERHSIGWNAETNEIEGEVTAM